MPCSGDCMLSMPVHGEVSKGRLPVDYWNAIYMRYIYIYVYIYAYTHIVCPAARLLLGGNGEGSNNVVPRLNHVFGGDGCTTHDIWCTGVPSQSDSTVAPPRCRHRQQQPG